MFQFYIPETKNHVFHLKAITHRNGALYHTIQAGSKEDIHLLALSREAKLYRALTGAGYIVTGVSVTPSLAQRSHCNQETRGGGGKECSDVRLWSIFLAKVLHHCG